MLDISDIHEKERLRLLTLKSYAILDSEPEKAFNSLVELASLIFDVPISTVTLVDEKRQWFKAKTGLFATETPRDISFCQYTINQSHPLVIENALEDPRFNNNPLVVGDPFLRFYAGVPLIAKDNQVIGSFCIMDQKPKNLSAKDLRTLQFLANQCMQLIEYRVEHSKYVDLTNEVIEANKKIIQNQKLWRTALDAAGNGVWDFDVLTGEAYFGANWYAMLGYENTELPPNLDTWINLLHEDDRENAIAELEQHISKKDSKYAAEFRMRCKNGNYKWILSSGSVIERDEFDAPLRMVGIHTDISNVKEKDHQIWMQANYDSLTNLPNRNLFFDRLKEVIKLSSREHLKLALFFIDLDGFKQVNDQLGHQAGDSLLKELAKRVKSHIRESDTFARLGGDEFTFILTEVDTEEYIKTFADKLINLIGSPFDIEGQQTNVTASIGISIYPHDGDNPDDLLKVADNAMYDAKAKGKNQYQINSKIC